MNPGLGKRIQSARQLKTLTQKQLGEVLGIHKETISRWERDFIMPSPDNMRDICKALDVSAEWLVTGDEGATASKMTRDLGGLMTDWRLVVRLTRELQKRKVHVDRQEKALPALYTWTCRKGDEALTDEIIDTILESIL